MKEIIYVLAIFLLLISNGNWVQQDSKELNEWYYVKKKYKLNVDIFH